MHRGTWLPEACEQQPPRDAKRQGVTLLARGLLQKVCARRSCLKPGVKTELAGH